MPEGITPIKSFDKQAYLGQWYEVARLDHSFEKGLEQVSAHYSLRSDGGVRVVNRGFSPRKNAWKEAKGKAFFMNDEGLGYLKVSFFGPFYGSYVIFELGAKNESGQYEYAFVSGPNTSYLWLLAREKAVSPALLDAFKARVTVLGFDIDELIMVKH